MRILAFDVGGVRIGVAVSDPTGIFAQPQGFIRAGDWEAMDACVAQWRPELVVVGHPVGLAGQKTRQTEAVERWKEKFAERFPDIKTVLFDERMTTRVADAALIESGVNSKRRKLIRDGVAAAVLLQNYLDRTV